MTKLFAIETDAAELSWSGPAGERRKLMDGIGELPGTLQLHKRRKCLQFTSVWRAGVPETVAFDDCLTIGPQLHEQTDYKVFVRSKNGKPVSLNHPDPNLAKSLVAEDDGRLVFGSINFGSEVGFSKFTVNVDGIPEFDFVIEVFPTKLDYRSDYEQLVAETQDFISGLVFEYLRSTFRLSLPVLDKQSSSVEWLLLLQLVVQDLERAASFIARHPIRGLVREAQTTKAEKIKRLDPIVKKSIQRGAGSGVLLGFENFHIRQQIPSRRTSFTLDTAEHRWISSQLKRIKDRLVSLRLHELEREGTRRRQKLIDELKSLEQRVLRIQQLDPFAACEEAPPAGFASLQLLSAPGYRECYRACVMLYLGLQIEGGPINLSLKEISVLYEYWCYLTVLQFLSEHTGQPMPIDQLVKTTHSGLEILLKKGKESAVSFRDENGRKISVVYNKHIAGDAMLVPQQPDIMISLEDADWPALNLLLDAKYRVRFEEEYVRLYGAPGPDIDAVNALHRYRDAILEQKQEPADNRPKRTIVQAAAMFPYRETVDGSFRDSRLWKSLDKLGIGAIPLVPGDKRYFKEWISTLLAHGGWSIADGAIGHVALDKAADWRIAASEPVLIGVLRTSIAEDHLDWIVTNQCYYMPLLKAHPRQLSVKWVAIYSPSAIRKPGAVTHKARVATIDVRPRSSIITPWETSADKEDLYVVYQLEPVQTIRRPIVNRGDDEKGQRFSTPRWGSRLSLDRARVITELLLETEPEWRLYEELRAAKLQFTLEPAAPRALDQEDPGWRTWFVIEGGTRIHYGGVHGFLLRSPAGEETILPNSGKIVERLRNLR